MQLVAHLPVLYGRWGAALALLLRLAPLRLQLQARSI